MSEHGYHRPVLLDESVAGLNIQPNGVYVDVTFGGGGHSREILKRLDKGRLIGFDQDPEAQKNALRDPRFTLVNQNFRFIGNWLGHLGIHSVDGILADLGVSSHQFDSGGRGFSIRFDAPLDMRMNTTTGRTAMEVINTSTHEDLAHMLRTFGEIQGAGRLASAIEKARPLSTTGDLMDAVRRYAPRQKEHKFFAQVFQALRIEVNDELAALEDLLGQSTRLLKPGGRLVVISYHSLEDRMIKEFLRTGNPQGVMHKDFYGNLIRPFRPVMSKAVSPSEKEIEDNTRSRSARLRIGERIDDTK